MHVRPLHISNAGIFCAAHNSALFLWFVLGQAAGKQGKHVLQQQLLLHNLPFRCSAVLQAWLQCVSYRCVASTCWLDAAPCLLRLSSCGLFGGQAGQGIHEEAKHFEPILVLEQSLAPCVGALLAVCKQHIC